MLPYKFKIDNANVSSTPYKLSSVLSINLLGKYAYQSGAVGSYFDEPSDHMATPLLNTPEEREAYADAGVQAINEFVKALDMQAVVETLRQVDVYTKDSILPKYGAHLPGGRA